jgi:hypothetical protein
MSDLNVHEFPVSAEARSKEQEAAEAEPRRKDQEAAQAEPRRKEQEADQAESRRNEQEVAEAEARRKEQEVAEAEARRKEQQAAEAAAPIRGALRIQVKTSSAELQAGVVFSVFVKISNPFETEVTIDNVSCLIPVEFKDVKKARDEFLEQIQKDLAVGRSASPLPGLPWDVRRAARSAEREFGGVSQVAYAQTDAPLPAQDADSYRIALQPGDSTIRHFTLKTREWLLFQPASYNLPISIDYTIGGRHHRDTVEFLTSIRAPLRAVMWGAGLGAFLGFLLHDLLNKKQTEAILLNVHGFWSFFGAIGLIVLPASASILSAALTIVAFARKRDAQPFITVEDFLGGMFVGTVIGYGGQNLLQTLIGAPGASNTNTPAP